MLLVQRGKHIDNDTQSEKKMMTYKYIQSILYKLARSYPKVKGLIFINFIMKFITIKTNNMYFH